MPKTNQEVTIEHYREMLSSACNEAITTMQTYLDNNPNADRKKILEKAYKIATVYGRASGTLAANKYDQDALLAERRGEIKPGKIKEAEIAELPGFGEIARAINGTMKNSSLDKVPETIGRMVKQSAEDTTLKNANRDGAEYAWITAGDTCVFCLSLAANGWQRASKSTAEGNHADHIHPHCDCTFSVRFSKDTQIAGYHPEKIKAYIESREGDTWAEKLNSLRREQYAEKRKLLIKQSGNAIILPNKTDITSSSEFVNAILNQHKLLKDYTPEEMKELLENLGYDVRPLSRGNLSKIPFEEGGGYKVNFGDDGIFQYHPQRGSHHGGAYWKIKNGEVGKHYDINGNEIQN